MVGLYDYDNATIEECFEDLYETIGKLNEMTEDDLQDVTEFGILKRRGIRLQNIAQRLIELNGE